MNRVFVDLDGVVVDFDAYMKAHGLTGDEVKARLGAYLDMPAIPGAIEAVRSIIGMGFEVWIATKPPTGVPHAYSDKAAWVMQHIPDLKRRIIVTHDKGLLGDAGDYLCDDRPHKANCEKFAGTLLRFVDGYHWPQALEHFRGVKAAKKAGTPGATWRAAGEPDPHGDRYDCERAALCMGKLTDDELANGVYLHGDGTHGRPSPQDIIAGKAHSPIAWLTAAKDRIRWLSRRLAEATAKQAGTEGDKA